MKKLITLILAFMMVSPIAAVSVAASNGATQGNEVALLAGLDLVPDGFASSDADATITRGEFAYIAAKLIKAPELEQKSTRFSDVTEEHAYSGYIEYLAERNYIGGLGDGTYSPDTPMSVLGACKILVNMVDYASIAESRGGYPNGYRAIAVDLGIYKGTEGDSQGNLTNGGAVRMVYNMLTKEITRPNYASDGSVTFTGNKAGGVGTYIADKFEISAYYGTVSNTDIAKRTINFVVDENRFDTNPVLRSNGDELLLELGSSINGYEFDGAPVIAWVDKDDNLLYLELQKDAEIRYAVIDSVNGNTDISAEYGVAYIREITIMDEEDPIDVSSNLTVKYNGKLTRDAVGLNGKYARLVLLDDEVVRIESWDLTSGGLITSAEEKTIKYMNNGLELTLNNILDCSERLYFINDACADAKDLRVDTMFDYYKNGDYIVIVSSEKMIQDKLIGISYSESGGQIEIGNLYYALNGEFMYSLDGETFKTVKNTTTYNKAVSDGLLNMTDAIVKAYVSPNGKIGCIILDDEKSLTRSEYYAIVEDLEYDDFDKAGTISLLVVSGSTVSKETYNLTNKTKYADGLDIDTIGATASDEYGSGIYKVTVDGNGIVTKIAKPTYYDNTVPVEYRNSALVADNDYAYVNLPSGKRIFFTDKPVLVLYKLFDGTLNAEFVKWHYLRGGDIGGNGGYITLYGTEKTELPELAVLSGDVGKVSSNYKDQYGVVVSKTTAIDENGDSYVKVTVLPSNDEFKLYIAEGEGGLKVGDYFTYYSDTRYSKSDFRLNSVLCNFDGAPEDWILRNPTVSLVEGTIEVAYDTKIYLTNGESYYVNTGSMGVKYVDGAKTKLKASTTKDLLPGKTVYLYLNSYKSVQAYVVID